MTPTDPRPVTPIELAFLDTICGQSKLYLRAIEALPRCERVAIFRQLGPQKRVDLRSHRDCPGANG